MTHETKREGDELIEPNPVGGPDRYDYDHLVDEVGDESFPASDPPPWTLGLDRARQKHDATSAARAAPGDRARTIARPPTLWSTVRRRLLDSLRALTKRERVDTAGVLRRGSCLEPGGGKHE